MLIPAAGLAQAADGVIAGCAEPREQRDGGAVAPRQGRGLMKRKRLNQKLLLLMTVSSLGLQIGLTTPSGAISLNNNDAGTTADAHEVYDGANKYSNVVWVGGCTGTLINSRTILTAAHCFVDDKTSELPPGLSIAVRFGADAGDPAGTPYDQPAIGVAVAPGYTFNGTDGDVAVVTLSTPVTGASIAPVILVGPNDPLPPPGSLMITVGYGQYGTGKDGGLYNSAGDPNNAPSDNRRRVGETRLGGYVAWDYGGRSPGTYGIFAAQFRDPANPGKYDDYQLDAKGFDVPKHQAGNGAGDSGGPLFLVLPDGSLVQIGILALLESAEGNTIRYGSISGWAAVQDYLAWLNVANPLRLVSARPGNVAWSDGSAWSESEVPNNQPGSLDGPYGLAGRYFDVRLFESGRVSLDMDTTIDALSVFGARTVLDVTANHTMQVITGAGLWAGQILLNGTMETPFLNMQGGTLSGTGTLSIVDFGVQDLAFGLFNQAGTIAPGGASQTGVLTVGGDYLQGSHGTLSVRLGDGASDSLDVTGQASLAGHVALSGFGPVVLNAPYTILTANHVAGTFHDVFSSFAFLDASLTYAPSSVSASLSRNGVAFADVARTANQSAVAGAFNALDPSGSLYRNVLALSAAEARSAFDLSSGEIHASVKSVLIDDSRYLRDAANKRLHEMAGSSGFRAAFNSMNGQAGNGHRAGQHVAGGRRGSAPFSSAPGVEGFMLWGHAYGTSGHIDGDGNASRVGRRSGGLLIGGDVPLDETWRLGALAGYSKSSFNITSCCSSGTSDNYHVGLYGGGSSGSVFLRSGAFYSSHDVSTSRDVIVGGFAEQARTAYRAQTVQAFGEIGTAWRSLTGTVEPYVNLAHVHLTTGGFAEQAQESALRAASQHSSVSFTTAGVRGSTDFALASQRMTLGAGMGWRHAFGDRLPVSTLGLSTADFTVAGAAIAQDAAVFDASIHSYLSDAMTFSLSYQGQIAANAAEHAATARLKIGF